MISDAGLRHVAQLRESLKSYEAGSSSLSLLVSDLGSLAGLLYEEVEQEWLAKFESESNRLESVNSSGPVGRELSTEESAEVAEAISQLRLIATSHEQQKDL